MVVSGRLAALHIASLWCIAVAQPLFDVLRGSPEFFVAHDTGPANLVGFVLLCCLAGPKANVEKRYDYDGTCCVRTAQATKEASPTNGMTKSAAVVVQPLASAHAAVILDNHTIGATNQNLGVPVRYRQNGAAKKLPSSTNEN